MTHLTQIGKFCGFAARCAESLRLSVFDVFLIFEAVPCLAPKGRGTASHYSYRNCRKVERLSAHRRAKPEKKMLLRKVS